MLKIIFNYKFHFHILYFIITNIIIYRTFINEEKSLCEFNMKKIDKQNYTFKQNLYKIFQFYPVTTLQNC